MKKMLPIMLGVLCLFVSCNQDDNSETAVFAVPITKSLAKIRSEVKVTSAKQTASDGKVYVTAKHLFYIAKESGVHIFDNSNPAAPLNIAFISLEGVHDIAVKGNYLFADNFVDLLIFDISDINNITLMKTVENTIEFMPVFPEDVVYYDTNGVDIGTDHVVVGYKKVVKKVPGRQHMENVFSVGDALANDNFSGGIVGQGGSYAKFQINKNALYTTDSYKLNVFNIADPVHTVFDKSVYMDIWINGGQFETLFRQGDFLFIGATNGMYIVNASDEFNPFFVSGFSHATACDPVVVSGNLAYITVRGGTSCGAIEDQINVIDITDISNPTLLSTTFLTQPKGLGIRNNELFVCCNEGIKIYNASNINGLVLENSYNDLVTDVIPLDSHLIAVGPNKIIQYNYGQNHTLQVLSTVNF